MLERGVTLEDGKTAPARVKIISWDKRKEMAIVQLTIHEGRNRQVRRMFEALDCKVVKLKRERYAFLEVGSLRPGDARELTPHEVKQLRACFYKAKISYRVKIHQWSALLVIYSIQHLQKIIHNIYRGEER